MPPHPTLYTPELAERICELVRLGASLRSIYRQEGMPCCATFTSWLARYPEFKAAYEAAKAERARTAAQTGARDRGRGGGATTYTPQLGERICDLLVEGASLLEVTRRRGMPARGTIYRWLDQNPDFQAAYGLACEFRADALADELVEIADGALTEPPAGENRRTPVPTRDLLQWAKIRMEARKWRVAALAPRKYGRNADRHAVAAADQEDTIEHWIDLLD